MEHLDGMSLSALLSYCDTRIEQASDAELAVISPDVLGIKGGLSGRGGGRGGGGGGGGKGKGRGGGGGGGGSRGGGIGRMGGPRLGGPRPMRGGGGMMARGGPVKTIARAINRLRPVQHTRPGVRLPSGYRLGRSPRSAPWQWAGRSRGLNGHRIGPGGGYIFRPLRKAYRPWGNFRRFMRGIGNGLGMWRAYPWFNLWYMAYLIDPRNPFAVNRYYSVAGPGLGLPELGYVDMREWTAPEIDEHIRELEMVYAATVAMGYRIIIDPATGRLLWVNNVRGF